jgi:hypothetical protein
MVERTDRRHFLNAALLGTAGAGAFLSCEERILHAASTATPDGPPQAPSYMGSPLATGKIRSLSVSRVIMGGNLIGGYAHSRDLLYVSRLLRAYNTDAKIMETLRVAEQSGVNTIQVHPGIYDVIERYRRDCGGKIQAIVNVDVEYDDLSKVRDQVQDLVGRGAHALYTHGMVTDRCVMNGQVERVGKVIDLIKAAGVPAGVGSHSLLTTLASEQEGLNPDFYVKTLHPDNYWSASPKAARDEWCWYRPESADHDGYHDNIFCVDPTRTAEVFQSITKPWLAFKVMAAGALTPQVGFQFAFHNGADFVIAGMFDFQVADDVEIAVKALKRTKDRPRAWRA